MLVLTIDTCFNACSVALGSDGRRVWHERRTMRQGHAEALLPMIDRVVTEAGIAMGDIERIGVTHGPGTFSGVRTGLAAARGLALAIDVPAVGFSSLLAIGIAAGGDVAVVMNAGRERLFLQIVGAAGEEVTPPRLLSVCEAGDMIVARGVRAIGNGVDVLRSSGLDARRADGDDDPDARFLIGLVKAADVPTSPPQPLYLREPDAKPQEGLAIERRR